MKYNFIYNLILFYFFLNNISSPVLAGNILLSTPEILASCKSMGRNDYIKWRLQTKVRTFYANNWRFKKIIIVFPEKTETNKNTAFSVLKNMYKIIYPWKNDICEMLYIMLHICLSLQELLLPMNYFTGGIIQSCRPYMWNFMSSIAMW